MRPPHHIKTGGQFEQDSAVLVQLPQRPVEQQDQIHVLLGRLLRHTQAREESVLRAETLAGTQTQTRWETE